MPRTSKQETVNALTLIKIWLDGWKKTFVLKGRSSRFELWVFILLNSIITTIIQMKCLYFLSPQFLRDAAQKTMELSTIDNYIITAEVVLYLSFIISIFPLGSLLIRRMHDIGLLAWKNYLEQTFMSMIMVWLLFIAIDYASSTDYTNTSILLTVFFITFLYALGYYCLKFLIPTLFYKGDEKQNKYGPSHYNTSTYEALALKFSCFYFLFITTLAVLVALPIIF